MLCIRARRRMHVANASSTSVAAAAAAAADFKMRVLPVVVLRDFMKDESFRNALVLQFRGDFGVAAAAAAARRKGRSGKKRRRTTAATAGAGAEEERRASKGAATKRSARGGEPPQKAARTEEGGEATGGGGRASESVNGMLTPVSCSDDGEPNRKKKAEAEAEDGQYEVERIKAYDFDDLGNMIYLVKWKGYSSKQSTYERIENLVGCKELLKKLFKTKPEVLLKIEDDVEKSLHLCTAYVRLVANRFERSEIARFSRTALCLDGLFGESLEAFHGNMELEYLYQVCCLVGKRGDAYKEQFVRCQYHRIALKLCEMRAERLSKLAEQERMMEELDGCPLRVENNVDMCVLPEELVYITESIPGKDIKIPSDFCAGCSCADGCGPQSRCCGKMAKSEFAYTKTGRLRVPEQTAIYECNYRCSCPVDCPNRVVQRGRKIPLKIFRTENRGWGVKAMQVIKKGQFVCEYMGEIITDTEALIRDDLLYHKRKLSYMYNLDFTEDARHVYTIDAYRYGSVSRFINHSCDPNLIVFPVWVDTLDPNLPRLAFFARRDVARDEELSIDYENIRDGSEQANAADDDDYDGNRRNNGWSERCHCKSANCRRKIFGNKKIGIANR